MCDIWPQLSGASEAGKRKGPLCCFGPPGSASERSAGDSLKLFCLSHSRETAAAAGVVCSERAIGEEERTDSKQGSRALWRSDSELTRGGHLSRRT